MILQKKEKKKYLLRRNRLKERRPPDVKEVPGEKTLKGEKLPTKRLGKDVYREPVE